MKAPCTLAHLHTGTWIVRHTSAALGTVEVSANSREEALTKMRNELQYRIELCPCSGVSGDVVGEAVTKTGSTRDEVTIPDGVHLENQRRKLQESGVAIEQEVEWPRGGKSIYLRDPAGNLVELVTPGVWGLPSGW